MHLGSDGITRTPAEHVRYLRACAERWRQEAKGWRKTDRDWAACIEQAAKVDRQADEIEKRTS